MNKEKQRIAIAEACGGSMTKDIAGFWNYTHPEKPDRRVAKHHTRREAWLLCAPDYLNDLNAMHEAEKTIRKPGLGLWCDYSRELRRVCDESLYSDIHATAAQRAEAFLRTIGKWEEEQ